MKLKLSLNDVVQQLAAIATILLVVSVTFSVGKFYVEDETFAKFARMFNVDEEHNIPTYFSSFTLLYCAALVLLIAIQKRRSSAPFATHWKLLAFTFVFLSVDEFAQLHEATLRPLQNFFKSHELGFLASGIFYYSWVIPAILCVAVFAIVFLKFVLHLPPTTRGLFLIAGAVYLSGSLGMEMASGNRKDSYGSGNIPYVLMTQLEETLELTGVLIFTYAAGEYLKKHVQQIEFDIAS